MQTRLLTMLVAGGLAAAFGPARADGVTDQMIQTEATTTGNVLTWGVNTQGQRYSPLKQVNAGSVAKLTPVWAFSLGGEKQRGQESQPVIYNGRMFVTGSYSRIYALDAATGAKLWKYEHRLPEGIMPCCDVVNRGAALFDNLVIFATLDAQLVALDQATGDVVWKVEDRRLRRGLLRLRRAADRAGPAAHRRLGRRIRRGGPRRGARPAHRQDGVVAPHGRRPHGATPTMRTARSTRTASAARPNQSWPGDLWKTGGAATWLGGTYDAKTGLAYFGTGNPSPWNSHMRPGDNLFSCVHAGALT